MDQINLELIKYAPEVVHNIYTQRERERERERRER